MVGSADWLQISGSVSPHRRLSGSSGSADSSTLALTRTRLRKLIAYTLLSPTYVRLRSTHASTRFNLFTTPGLPNTVLSTASANESGATEELNVLLTLLLPSVNHPPSSLAGAEVHQRRLHLVLVGASLRGAVVALRERKAVLEGAAERGPHPVADVRDARGAARGCQWQQVSGRPVVDGSDVGNDLQVGSCAPTRQARAARRQIAAREAKFIIVNAAEGAVR